ncbi:MAG: phosphate acetyltransferase [PVC group bacterium]|nr:phosphate acetyltransferase [PVC group bacterium]
MDIISELRKRSREKSRTIVLPEAKDSRILEAAKIIIQENYSNIILLSDEEVLKNEAAKIGLDLSAVKVIDPLKSPEFDGFAQEFFELRKHKGVTIEDATEQMKDFVYFGAMMVRKGMADGMVAGAITTTADVAKSAIYCIGFGEQVRTLSSCFLMSVPDSVYGEKGTFVFADCGIIPDPKPAQLANIAKASAELFRLLVEAEPRVALLSFSSKGSADHPMVDKVVNAMRIIGEKFPELIVDGELQLDAAIVPEVAKIKAPDSNVAGRANVLIFPSLDSGNISYKMVQRLAKAQVVGPMLIGFKKPCCDLSRGCTIDEIINAVCSTAIRVME